MEQMYAYLNTEVKKSMISISELKAKQNELNEKFIAFEQI